MQEVAAFQQLIGWREGYCLLLPSIILTTNIVYNTSNSETIMSPLNTNNKTCS